MKYKTIIEPFRVKMVESIRMTTEKEREKFLKEAKYNLFLLKAEDVIIDLLTDSGTAAMSSKQWAGMMIGDESYAGAKSWKKMEATIKDLTGYRHVLPTHQGRAAERILYGCIGGKGKTFISNTHFDTTRANIEFSNAEAIDCPTEIGKKPSAKHPFKGNMNVSKLISTIKERGQENVAGVILTVTNNSGGGQPVSMKNAKKVSEICKKHKIPLIIDACRIAENAYFIKQREKAYKNNTYKEIAQKMNEAFAKKSNGANSDINISSGAEHEIEQNDEAELTKIYYALVRGHLPINEQSMLIDHSLKEKLDKLGDKNVSHDKAPQSAQTYYHVVKQASLPIPLGKFDSVRYSLVRLEPLTGRRHQIRRHLAHLRHPIIGDINYGDNKQNPFFIKHFGFKRLMLIAKSLSFIHPITKKVVTITAEFDDQWQHVFKEFDWSLNA